MADIHTGTVKTDEFSMDYLKFGRGERTLVILPGLSVQRVMLSANAVANAYKQLTEDFTVYLFERRNELPGIYSVYDMARDTIKAIEALGLERFSLLGASQGGMIAMVIASEKPMLVEKMILASTSAAVTDRQYEALFDGWIRLAEAGDKQGLYLAFGESIYPDEIFEQSKKLIIQAAKTVTDKDLERFIILARGICNTCNSTMQGKDPNGCGCFDSSYPRVDAPRNYNKFASTSYYTMYQFCPTCKKWYEYSNSYMRKEMR